MQSLAYSEYLNVAKLMTYEFQYANVPLFADLRKHILATNIYSVEVLISRGVRILVFADFINYSTWLNNFLTHFLDSEMVADFKELVPVIWKMKRYTRYIVIITVITSLWSFILVMPSFQCYLFMF